MNLRKQKKLTLKKGIRSVEAYARQIHHWFNQVMADLETIAQRMADAEAIHSQNIQSTNHLFDEQQAKIISLEARVKKLEQQRWSGLNPFRKEKR